MRVRDWKDVVADVVERDVDPDRWRAVAGDRAGGPGEDLYVGHPDAGLFLLKTYARNPFEVEGVGARVARRIDDDIGPYLPREDDATGRFGMHAAPEGEDEAERRAKRVEEVVRTHAEAPTTPGALFDDVMTAVESPAFGPMAYDQYDRPDDLEALGTTFEEAEELIDAELEDLLDEDGIGRGFQ